MPVPDTGLAVEKVLTSNADKDSNIEARRRKRGRHSDLHGDGDDPGDAVLTNVAVSDDLPHASTSCASVPP